MVLLLRLIVVINLILSASTGFAFKAEDKFTFKKEKIQLNQGNKSKTLLVEIAETEEQQARGLMFREKLKTDEGMLFIFKNEEPRSFWMKNTIINLSIGYFNKDKKLIDIQEMKAVTSVLQQDIPTYPSQGPAQYALEMPEGWFKKNHFTTGAVLKLKHP